MSLIDDVTIEAVGHGDHRFARSGGASRAHRFGGDLERQPRHPDVGRRGKPERAPSYK